MINIIRLYLVLQGTEYVWFKFIMVFNATFNNISAISWGSVLMVEETEVPGENHGPVTIH